MTDAGRQAAVAPATDEGLRCPQCGYNLTGLAEPRCPECGAAFDWAQVRAAAHRGPAIAFERARGWRKLPAFFLTAATVLLAPWVFARQMQHRASLRHAAVFFVLCFVPALARAIADRDDYFNVWLVTAAECVLIEALLLWALERLFVGTWNSSLRRWLCAGGYTTAVVLTESLTYPPALMLSELIEWLAGPRRGWVHISFIYEQEPARTMHALQVAGWIVPLVWVLMVRLRRAGRTRMAIALLTPVVVVLLLLLYTLICEYVYPWTGTLLERMHLTFL